MTMIELSARKTTSSNDKTLEEMTRNLRSLIEQLRGVLDINDGSTELKSHISALVK